jgi:hypothetical protein
MREMQLRHPYDAVPIGSYLEQANGRNPLIQWFFQRYLGRVGEPR